MPARRDTHEHAVGKKNLKFMSNKQFVDEKAVVIDAIGSAIHL
jgi:hypothetical protein